MQAAALVAGFILVCLLGIGHHWGLRGLDRFTGRDEKRPDLTIISVFVGLLAIHTIEIVAFAGAYGLLLGIDDFGSLGGDYQGN